MRRGPLVSEKFRDVEYDRDAVRSNLGLAPEDRAVLVVAGSWGVGDVVETVEDIGRSGEFHPITVCGRDDNLRAELEARGFGTVIGWTDQMPALMSAADALVENAGGLTCMEAFAVGLPVITYKPIAGHGKDNAKMMARAGVNCYARDEDELNTILREVTRPGPERDALVETARLLFVADPADDVEELAQSEHLVDRKGRVVALRAPRGRRTVMVAAMSALVLYGGLTLGAQAVSAIGVGVAKPPKGATHTAYVGVRLDHTQLRDTVAARCRSARSVCRSWSTPRRRSTGPPSSSISPPRASTSPTADGARARSCGGTAPATTSPRRARSSPRRPANRPASSVPVVASMPSTSTTRTSRSRSSWSRTTPSAPRTCPDHLESGKVYVLDGRDRDATAMEVAVSDLEAQFTQAGMRAAPLGELR